MNGGGKGEDGVPVIELPQNELDAFTRTIIDARRLAAAGDVLNGYRCLLDGLARALDQQDRGVPWARALATGYCQALESYGAGWGLRVEQGMDTASGLDHEGRSRWQN